MCGRFSLFTAPSDLAEWLGLPEVPDLPPRYNVAPNQPVAAVRAGPGGGRELVRLRWGLVPPWSADPGAGPLLINARAETAADKPAFRAALRARRCLLPASGFYEWVRGKAGKKQPIHFRLRDGRPFAFAALWERWQAPGGPAVESCAILTTVANELVRPVHDRMPVILDPAGYCPWLDPAVRDPAALAAWLRPFPAEAMTASPVNTWVNNPRNEGPAGLAPPP
jgi:putative SOS response-associated peptidase YedK